MKKLILISFVLVCLAQWYVPGAMIATREDVVRNGTPFRFRTEPVDPSDPFRGKYITLSFQATTFPRDTGVEWRSGQNVFVVLREDKNGFAQIGDVVKVPPEAHDFVEAEVAYTSQDDIIIQYPFERFYLEESKASAAETVYREGNARDSTQITYARVRVKGGKAVVEDVIINDRSIVDIVRERGGE